MSRTPLSALGLACGMTLSIQIGSASQPPPAGPRSIALGNAFTAVADDASAIYWNPAGLPWIGHQEIAMMHADLFGTGIKENNITFVLPITHPLALAANATHTGFDDGELDFGDTSFRLAGGLKVHKRLSLGLNAKYLTRNTGLDDVSVRKGDAFGLDLGVLATPIDRFTVGVALHDAFDTKMHYSEGNGSSVIYERRWNVGVAYRPLHNGLVSVDIDDRFHLGAEFSPLNPIAFRAGFEKDLKDTGLDPIYGLGVGIRAGIIGFDYALSLHPELGNTNYFGVSLGFNFNPSRVRIEKVESRDVYMSLQKSYAENPFGTVQLQNLQDTPITARLSVFSPDLMDQATEHEIVLRPGATQNVPLMAALSDKVLDLREDRRVSLSVAITYSSYRLPRTERRTVSLIAYAPGALAWADGVDQAGAFVTQTDPAVMEFARESCRSIAAEETSPFRNRNLGYVAAVVDALAALNMTYIPDPNTPFQASSQSPGTLDTVHYPRETLALRAGDCDDTSVLLAALLESVGVPTCFVDVPGHLFVLAGTGVHERNALAFGIDPQRYVVYENEVWIPIETTILGKGFAEVWQQGAQAFASRGARGAPKIVRVTRAQARYSPSGVPNHLSAPAYAVDATSLSTRLAGDAAVVDSWKTEYMSNRFGATRDDLKTSPAALDEIAHVYLLAGQASRAQTMLELAIAQDPASVRYKNNLANTYAAQDSLSRAIEYYRAALQADSTDAGIWLNLGLVRHMSGDSVEGDAAIVQAVKLSGGFEDACRLLGLADKDIELREGTPKLSQEEARELLRDALSKVPETATAVDSTSSGNEHQGKAPSNLRVASARAAEWGSLEVGGILYWKN